MKICECDVGLCLEAAYRIMRPIDTHNYIVFKAGMKKDVKDKKIKKPGDEGKKEEVFVSRNGRDVTWEVRSELFPDGCSTCRHREGCTRSCWIRRRLD